MLSLSYVRRALNICLGSATVVLNLLIFLAIAKERKIRQRKEFLVIGALAFADILFGLNYAGAGTYYIYLSLTNQTRVLVSPWQCLFNPLSFFKIYGVQLSSVMLACVSADRLWSVINPAWYVRQQIGYARRLIGVFYAIAFINSSAMVFVSYSKRHGHLVPKSCNGFNTVGGGAAAGYLYASRMLFPTVSVIIYAAIPFIYGKSAAGADMDGEARKIKRQRRMVKTLGLSSFFTFVFYILPNVAKLVVAGGLIDHKSLSVLVKIIGLFLNSATLINPIANYFLYTMRHKAMNDAVKKLIWFGKGLNHGGQPAARRIAF